VVNNGSLKGFTQGVLQAYNIFHKQVQERKKMNTSLRKPSHRQQIFNPFLAFGLIILLLAPATSVAAQAGEPPAPLFPQLTWTDLGPAERAFEVNGESVTPSGTLYQAEEQFNLEASDAIAAYYSSTNLRQSGWQKVSTTPYPNGVSSIYFNSAGVYTVVEFVGCEAEARLTCLTVWQSNPTDIIPSQN
jgi:hypothetical protein